ncbi:MAG: hypothetical protein LIP23_09220 [Planctomycetes bacterium]|nr:hypothetical protein [Planctomycetota bacterium]
MLTVTANHVAYRGGEEGTLFPIPFPFLESSHIAAQVRMEDGEEKTLAPGTDYRIDKAGDSGELVLLNGPLAAGKTLVITRLVPLTQETIFHNQGPNSPKATEDSLDKLTMISQQLQAGLAKSFVLPEYLDPDEAVATLAETPQVQQQLRSDIGCLETTVESNRTVLSQRVESVAANLREQISGTATTLRSEAAALRTGLENSFAASLAQSASAIKTEVGGTIAETKADLESSLAKAKLDLSGEITDSADRLRSDIESIQDIAGEIEPLRQEVAEKAALTDTRLSDARTPTAHALSHSVSGADPLTPQAIGCLPRPPDDGKTYVASSSGWVEHIDGSGGGEPGEGGTEYHTNLLHRDYPNQHPQSAITGLADDLENVRAAITQLSADVETGKDHATLENRDGADQHPQAAITGLAADLSSIRADIAELEQRRVILDHQELTGRDADNQHPVSAIAGLAAELDRLDESVEQVRSAAITAHAGLSGRDGADQHPQSAITGLTAALGDLNTRLAAYAELIVETPSQDKHLIGKGYADNLIASFRSTLAAPAFAPGPPADGAAYGWKDGAWVAVGGSGGGEGAAGLYVPELRLFMQQPDELPSGWYFPSGELVALSSELGKALNNLSTSIKTNWGVVKSGSYISLFSLDKFFSSNRGRFLRIANGTSRTAGSTEEDAIRNISGEWKMQATSGMMRFVDGDSSNGTATGAFTTGATELASCPNIQTKKGRSLVFNASLQVPTADENRPCNVGLIPAVYMGVVNA